MTLASHTRTHPLLTRVPAETVREELRASLEDLEREIGSVPPLFAYPGGRYDEGVVQLVMRRGSWGSASRRGVDWRSWWSVVVGSMLRTCAP